MSSSCSCTLADWQIHRYLQVYLSLRDKNCAYEALVSLDFLEWILHTIDLHLSNRPSENEALEMMCQMYSDTVTEIIND